jgi:hypothetical protein
MPKLAELTGLPLKTARNKFAAQGPLDAMVAVSAGLRGVAVALMLVTALSPASATTKPARSRTKPTTKAAPSTKPRSRSASPRPTSTRSSTQRQWSATPRSDLGM